LLPPSKMNLGNVKRRMLSESESKRTKEFFNEFYVYFWSNFDDKGFSIWTCDYLNNSDNTQLWMTSNLVGGTVKNYVEENADYIFGVLNIIGKDEDTAPFKINGACIFRGTEMMGGVSSENSPKALGLAAESYKWTRLDTNNPDHRKKFEELFSAKSFGKDQVLDRKYIK